MPLEATDLGPQDERESRRSLPMLYLHIVGGLLAILAGALALMARKGGVLHRRSGRVFGLAMLLMTASALLIATYLRPNPGNIIAASLTGYLVLSGIMTVRSPRIAAHGWRVGLLLWVSSVATAAALLSRVAADAPGGAIDGIPYQALIMFSLVAGLAAIGDVRLLLGRELAPTQRIRRHLWRMGYAMWIATTSLFLGQAKQFPDSWQSSGWLGLPILLVMGVLLFEWWRAGRQSRPRAQPTRLSAAITPAQQAD
ncbi:DUF2306 domain-containing protein [Pseudomarimonas arenosa]|uniref:DUF2306 domain-containing protein n=1 Tax=Pseudomarimonas arenosa TaxID=2774145 RepID=A0AAW3ZNC0_9GAMM|nr:DUF2306 domain-containing protein [Pseudomarimonas arenosa]MBD8526420.1 DUF2306 domain-containing protein [Pseudomarimonas arenosa]